MTTQNKISIKKSYEKLFYSLSYSFWPLAYKPHKDVNTEHLLKTNAGVK